MKLLNIFGLVLCCFLISCTSIGSEKGFVITNIETSGRFLQIQGDLVNSGKRFVKYKIVNKRNCIYIYIYSALIWNTKAPSSGRFNIQYTVPDGIEFVYMEDENSLRTVWKNE